MSQCGKNPTRAFTFLGVTVFLFTAAISFSGCGISMRPLPTVEAGSTAKTTPSISWATPAAITYGTALSSAQLNATASAPGTFAYSPAAGSMPPAGTDTLTVTFTPTDTTAYNTATKSVSLVVGQPAAARSTPTITWASPAAITYGAALSSTQLDAAASVAGTFAYSPAAGSMLSAGTHTLSVTFTPSNTASYSSATKSVPLVVAQKTPSIAWTSPAEISYGTALSSRQLNATASVAGTFVYSPASGTVLSAGTHTLTATFNPSNSTDYVSASKSVSIIVNSSGVSKTNPTITWHTPAAITYGTALSSAQLDATASVPGTFIYSPAAGTVPPAGINTLTVSFTPSDRSKYNAAAASVSLAVYKTTTTKTTPTITWPTPAAITYGTALSSKQLDATSSVAGTFVYSPAAGTVPAVGTDTLTVAFTPTDTTDYNTATASVSLTVNKATTTKTTPTITWHTPAPITYGTALSSAQLDATASVAGTFVYSPAAGTVPAVGTDTLTVAFTPTDSTDYNNTTASVALTVNSSTSPTGTSLNACADLTASGTYYLAQDVSSSGTCFFIDADNITLNLNGHTITYDTGGGAGAPGILLADTWYTGAGYKLQRAGSTSKHGGFVMYGGTLQESANGGIQSRGIWAGESNDISPAPVIHDVTINTYTQDAEPIFGTITASGWQIYNNTLNWNCNSTYPATGTPCDSNRYNLFGYALWVADADNASGAIPDQIYNNKILNAPQGGIYDTHQNAQIHNNDVTFNAYFSNDYCVANVSGNGQVISKNNCHPTSGRGIDVEAANTQVLNNTISVTERAQNSEYGGCELAGADGIRVRDNYAGGTGNPAQPSDVTVSGNTITATANQCQANGLRLTNTAAGDTETYSNNVVTTSSANGNVDYAISFDNVDQPPISFSGNALQSMYAWVQVDWDGANTSIGSNQTWVGAPKYFVDDENGYLASGGPTFSQSISVDDLSGGKAKCGAYAAGPVIIGNTSIQCN